jgi:hypothetical protein
MIKFNAKLLAAVAVAQSIEQTRYCICGVYFKGNLAIATNGTMVTVARDPDATNESGIYSITSKAITALKGVHASHVSIGGNQLSVMSKGGPVPLYTEPCTAIDGTFPDYRRVVPLNAKVSGKGIGSLGAWVLGKVVRTAEILESKTTPLTVMTPGLKSDPHIVRYSARFDIFSVAMPLGYDGYDELLPEWWKP